MPEYKARSVTATLRVAKLDKTLSGAPELMKKTDAQHAKHIEEVIANGDRLYERPIGPDGSEKGAARFIGEYEDLPFFMVEAGEHIAHVAERYAVVPTIETPPPASAVPELSNFDAVAHDASSPLTSLGNTPSFGTPETSFLQESQDQSLDLSRHDSVLEPPPKEQTPPAPILRALGGFPPKQYRREPTAESQAISLTLEIGCKARARKEDVKMEVFLNGTLVGADYINTKRFTLTQESSLYTQHFHGTRLHVQIEKPWIYRAADHASQSQISAEERWSAVAELIAQEANIRGCDAKGMPAPSAEYLNALSSVAIAERLKDKPQSTIIDVVVTTGEGRKFSSNHAFITEPLRLSSAKHGERTKSSEQVDPPVDKAATVQDVEMEDAAIDEVQTVDQNPTATDSSDTAPVLPSTSPDIPLARRTRSFSEPEAQETLTASPPKKGLTPIIEKGTTPGKKVTAAREKVDALAKELGISPQMNKLVASFKSRRGKTAISRTVTERLSDILKMNAENQEKAKLDLVTQLSNEGVLPAKPASIDGSGFSPVKKQKLNPAASSQSGARQETPVQNLPNAADVPMPDVGDDPVAALAQARMDTALDFGAAPNGHLAKRIESLSPHRTPVKRLGGSSWGVPIEGDVALEGASQEIASRNTSVSPTKLRRGRSKVTADGSEASEQMLDKEELAVQPAEGPPASKSRSAATGGTKKSAAPTVTYDTTPEEAMAAFEMPKICQGGSISYANPDQHRTVVKLRPGEFNEQSLVVGMRFVVL
ncbi:hypothetical protein M409DRAFT_20375 [Zasmidium cellare ATCC 36951]|uniref:Uncharacterized protein n=1 Tax=Zasmidium cellare ATCC 36951 TaxID=1080233 RepID=A0A6A6CSL7_ZASCE|nr:uncharacterized protein M409DRAFT_20375 [Zasmidium cellare ATCC 36951]KAF2169150.1 hypothetical protein M409DRAFT_20375 [Zasmidium cellare ATCC 36951]